MTTPNQPTELAVCVEGVSKSFGDHHAVDDVSFSLSTGEFLAIIGLSGSGKSTLLRLLNGLHAPSCGNITVLGTGVTQAKGRTLRHLRGQIGFIFQQFHLVGRISCMENVLSGALGRLRMPRLGIGTYPKALRHEALDHLDRVGLGHKAFQRADTLSGGEQQRVAIARALMQQPKLLLADEPVASLDPESSVQVMTILKRICAEENLTVICSLHQVDMALDWAHRIIGLRAGQIVLDQPTGRLDKAALMEVYQRPPTETVDPQHQPSQLITAEAQLP
ncbi:phosphonate ABC transporter ATP-binding protein [Allorhizocola rhizosphaerae]|uniref:phosphonate ABC transporter ATP-binding protein n=1 Tax=Allorhizocola rhizosphaerae TaxID=1872709 RepID=UPI001B8D0A9C|nr:phosphonate ABC transporter ATP-binding protein [Allorhizocola rhizosphaerae]